VGSAETRFRFSGEAQGGHAHSPGKKGKTKKAGAREERGDGASLVFPPSRLGKAGKARGFVLCDVKREGRKLVRKNETGVGQGRTPMRLGQGICKRPQVDWTLNREPIRKR